MSPTAWDLSPPAPVALGDREVPLLGEQLAGKRVALLVTGGIAAMKAPLLARALRKRGAVVVAFASREALRYVAEDALHWSTGSPVVTRLSPLAEHLSDDAPFDAFLVAPASYNTLNKLAIGIADNAVTAPLAGALGRLQRGECAVLVAPTMHGSMHNPILSENLRRLQELGVRVIPPRPGYGKHNIPHEDALVAEVARAISRSPLRGQDVAVLAPRAVGRGFDATAPLHQLRLSHAVAWELWTRGAEVTLIGDADGPAPPPPLEIDALAPGITPQCSVLVTWEEQPASGSVQHVVRLPGPASPGDPPAGAVAVADQVEALVG